ncbi:response regulator [Maribacter sp. MMG018]|uniref:response regulator n=1 Tax=Maribacter sp. MMG018 TaxID=2822688 RepID=UPI001B384FE0|nr:response regulator [Maribacter sp. MMG018]MBQ4916175.1 response regulator [Maribacter sp. MMG018]
MKKFKLISIVDDDPIAIFGIHKMLNITVECETIESYENGKVALDGLTKRFQNSEAIPEVIFLDINMPIMDGWQFLEEFIKLPIPKKIRINIVTSSIDPYDKEKWESYKDQTHHLITFNNKPMKKDDIAEITKIA